MDPRGQTIPDQNFEIPLKIYIVICMKNYGSCVVPYTEGFLPSLCVAVFP